jgi:hypothetical protein
LGTNTNWIENSLFTATNNSCWIPINPTRMMEFFSKKMKKRS